MDGRNFILNTDTPIDQIIGYTTGTITTASFNFTDVTIPHGFSTAPPYYIRWSTDPTFSISYEETGRSAGFDIFVGCETNNTNIIIRTNNNTGASITIYYRVILFSRYDASFIAPNTQVTLDAFNINTDYNYPAIHSEGYLPKVSGSFSHGLGYVPAVEAWFVQDDGTFTRYLGSTLVTGLGNRLTVTSSEINWLNNEPIFSVRIYYRIYASAV